MEQEKVVTAEKVRIEMWRHLRAVQRHYALPRRDAHPHNQRVVVEEEPGTIPVSVYIEEYDGTCGAWRTVADTRKQFQHYLEAREHAQLLWYSRALAAGWEPPT